MKLGLLLPNQGVVFGATTVPELIELAERAEASEVFESLWVGDNLLAKPRLESVTLLSALAVRCWPEFFTEYGCAACGPMAMTSQSGIPCACEADVYGAVTGLLLQAITDAPSFMADLVDVVHTLRQVVCVKG